MAVESVCDLSETAELWGRLLKSCHFEFTRLLRRHRKRAVCWRASENEPFVEAPPETNRLLTRHRKLTVCCTEVSKCCTMSVKRRLQHRKNCESLELRLDLLSCCIHQQPNALWSCFCFCNFKLSRERFERHLSSFLDRWMLILFPPLHERTFAAIRMDWHPTSRVCIPRFPSLQWFFFLAPR